VSGGFDNIAEMARENLVVSGGAVYFHPASRRAWIDRCEFIGNAWAAMQPPSL